MDFNALKTTFKDFFHKNADFFNFYDIYARNAIKKQVFKNVNSACGNDRAWTSIFNPF